MFYILEKDSSITTVLQSFGQSDFVTLDKSTFFDVESLNNYILKNPVILIQLDLLDKSDIPGLKKILSLGYYYAFFYKKKSEDIFKELGKVINQGNLGFYDLEIPIICHQSFLSSVQNRKESLDTVSPQELKDLGNDINAVLQKVNFEMNRLKKFHAKWLPLKSEELKGVKYCSKFSAGESVGGEFIDIKEVNGKIVIVIASTNSYLLSSSIVTHLYKLFESNNLSKDSLEATLLDVSTEIKTLSENKKKRVLKLDLFLGILNTKNLTFEGFNFGDNIWFSGEHFVGSNEYPVLSEFFSKAYFSFSLKKEMPSILISSGVKKNTKEFISGENYLSFIKNRLSKSKEQIIEEVFFNMRKERENEFLEYDASMLYFEASKNVIHEI